MKPFDLASVLGLPELPAHMERVDAVLRLSADGAPENLRRPIARLLQKGGKRLRPALVLASARIFGKPINDDIVAAGVAIELIHISSLVHDDIMDHADTRWNVPTISAREGNELAILVGDYLFAKGCATAATVGPQAAEIVAQAFVSICEGQAREFSDLHNLHRTEAALMSAIDGKTASLIAASCQLGGLCAGASERDLKALGTFGTAFGRSFQLVDDALDFIGNPEKFGKPVGNDVREGNYTLPLILALQGAQANEVEAALQNSPEKLPVLLRNTIEITIQKARNYNRVAKQSLANIPNTETISALKNLPETYTIWALTSLTQPALEL